MKGVEVEKHSEYYVIMAGRHESRRERKRSRSRSRDRRSRERDRDRRRRSRSRSRDRKRLVLLLPVPCGFCSVSRYCFSTSVITYVFACIL